MYTYIKRERERKERERDINGRRYTVVLLVSSVGNQVPDQQLAVSGYVVSPLSALPPAADIRSYASLYPSAC